MITGDSAMHLRLTAVDRRILSQERYSSADRAKIPHLYAPYEDAFLRFARLGGSRGFVQLAPRGSQRLSGASLSGPSAPPNRRANAAVFAARSVRSLID